MQRTSKVPSLSNVVVIFCSFCPRVRNARIVLSGFKVRACDKDSICTSTIIYHVGFLVELPGYAHGLVRWSHEFAISNYVCTIVRGSLCLCRTLMETKIHQYLRDVLKMLISLLLGKYILRTILLVMRIIYTYLYLVRHKD